MILHPEKLPFSRCSGRALRAVLAVITLTLLSGCSPSPWAVHQGAPVSMSDYQGQWLLVNYWAIWCGPCREEMPELNLLDQQQNISVLGVNYDRLQGAELQQQIETLKVDFPVLLDDPTEDLGIPSPKGLPVTVMVSPQGEVHEILLGPQTVETIQRKIQSF